MGWNIWQNVPRSQLHCELVHLTELTIFTQDDGMINKAEVKLPNNLSALTKLKLLQVWLNSKTLPADMAYRCIQLRNLDLWSSELENLPKSFTSCGAFPALKTLKLCFCKLVKFPEVKVGALPKLQGLDLSGCSSLITLALSIHILTTLTTIWVDRMCVERVLNSCRIKWKSQILLHGFDQLPLARRRRYIFRDFEIEDN
jgi:hypothetical protein